MLSPDILETSKSPIKTKETVVNLQLFIYLFVCLKFIDYIARGQKPGSNSRTMCIYIQNVPMQKHI